MLEPIENLAFVTGRVSFRDDMLALVKPIGMLKSYIGGQAEISVEAGRTVREVVTGLGMPPEIVALVRVNDERQSKDYLLQDGDVVKLAAVVGGG